MTYVLTAEQLDQVVNNTIVVLLMRTDLLPEWRANLADLLQQARQAQQDDEMLFVAAVLALLDSPRDTLLTGTHYDNAWQALMTGLQLGTTQSVPDQTPALSLEQLLGDVVEATVAVLTDIPEQKAAIISELSKIQVMAQEAEATELIRWLGDVRGLLNGLPAAELGQGHQDLYATYWDMLVQTI